MLTVTRKPNGVPALVNVFENFFNKNFPEQYFDKGAFVPSVNVSETDAAFTLEFAVPGFEKKDFDVQIEKEYITISGKKEMSNETKDKNYTRKEFSFSTFKRTFTIPENVATDKIEAVYENGILNLVLPKKEVKENTTSKKVEIK